MIDETRMEELRAEIGDDVEEVMLLYLDEAEEAIGRLQVAEGAAARTELLHFLRSGALNLGFGGLARIAARAEARDEEARDWPEVIATLRAALASSRDVLTAAAAAA